MKETELEMVTGMLTAAIERVSAAVSSAVSDAVAGAVTAVLEQSRPPSVPVAEVSAPFDEDALRQARELLADPTDGVPWLDDSVRADAAMGNSPPVVGNTAPKFDRDE